MEVLDLREVKEERLKKHKPEAFKLGVREVKNHKIMKSVAVAMAAVVVSDFLLGVVFLGQPIIVAPLMFFGMMCGAAGVGALFAGVDSLLENRLPSGHSKEFKTSYKMYKEVRRQRRLGASLATLAIAGVFAGVAFKSFTVGSRELRKGMEENKKVIKTEEKFSRGGFDYL